MTAMRKLYDGLNRGPGRALISAVRAGVLTVRGEPTRVGYDASCAGWVHRSRDGVLVLAEPRGWSVRGWERLNREIFLRDYVPVQGDVVVELGAGVGTETLSLSRLVGVTGRVVAVEAHPATVTMLERMVELNRLDNVTVVHAAVLDVPGEVRISDLDVAHTQENRVGASGVPVPGVTLDGLAEDLDLTHVDLLKSNIEGAEAAALRGGRGVLGRTRHAVIGCHDFLADETGDDSYRTLAAVRDLLTKAGFTVERREDDRPWAAGYLYAARGQ